MNKSMFLAIVFLFCKMTLFAQVSFGEVQIRHEGRIVLVTYGFTNTYDDINIFTLGKINGRMPRTLNWELINDVMANELKIEEMLILLLDWKIKVGKDFFYSEVIW